MAKQKTDKCYLRSLHGDSWITESQFLAEKICAKKSQIEKKHLPTKFWTSKEWGRFLVRQIGLATSLLKTYPFIVILESLNDNRCNQLLSFGGMYVLSPVLKEKMELYTQKNKNLKESNKFSTEEKPRQPLGKKSILSQLD